MVFTRAVVVSWGIFLIYLNSVQAQKCDARDFSKKLQPKVCPDGQFCNVSTSRCNTCGQCYDIFENNIKIKKGDIETILRNLIEKYRKQLTELQKALETLLKNIEQLETELKLLNIMNNQVKRRMNNLQEQIKQLQKDIKKVEEALKKIGEDVVAELKTIKDKIKNIQDRLKKLNFDTDNIALLNIDKFNNITNNLDDMERRFPKIDNTSLNLALSIESDIDLLESIIKSFEGNGTTFPQNAKASTNWIEPDLLWLINVLTNYENVSIDVDSLKRNASNAKFDAQQTLSTLNPLIKKHEDFEKHVKELEPEIAFYQDLDKLLKDLQLLEQQIKDFEKLLKIWRRKLHLHKEVTAFQKERRRLDKKEEKFKKKYQLELDPLWRELNNVLEQYESLTITKSVDEIPDDIERIIKEIEEIQGQILSHCSSAKLSVKRG